MGADEPFGLFITWTCYGTWLPGDQRGYVSDTPRPDAPYTRKKNVPGTPYSADDAYTHNRARQRQKSSTAELSREQAGVVVEGLVEAAAGRQWRILRAAVMYGHVHVVITGCPDDGPQVRRVLKGTTQARLSKHVGRPRRWWTKGGSDRYLHGEAAICAKVDYVAQQEGLLAEIVDMEVFKYR